MIGKTTILICRSLYDADIARYSAEFGINGNAVDGLYNMIKAWPMSKEIVLAGSERKLKLLERANHVVSAVVFYLDFC